jgi:hypothetical protein
MTQSSTCPGSLVANLSMPMRLLIPGEAAHHNEMIAPAVTE